MLCLDTFDTFRSVRVIPNTFHLRYDRQTPSLVSISDPAWSHQEILLSSTYCSPPCHLPPFELSGWVCPRLSFPNSTQGLTTRLSDRTINTVTRVGLYHLSTTSNSAGPTSSLSRRPFQLVALPWGSVVYKLLLNSVCHYSSRASFGFRSVLLRTLTCVPASPDSQNRLLPTSAQT